MRLYNNAYNNQVKRVWDASPFYIPGLAPGMKLHPFQNAMVRRLHTESGLAATKTDLVTGFGGAGAAGVGPERVSIQAWAR